MTPPPPPSPSYILVLDTSSSEGSDSEEKPRYEEPAVRLDVAHGASVVDIVAPPPQDDSTSRSDSLSTTDDHSAGMEEKEDNDSKQENESADSSIPIQESSPPKSAKKKKGRKRKKKSKKKKSVRFGHVSIRQHERTLGSDVVPLDGGWPLGLLDTIVHQVQDVDIDVFEQERQLRLQERFKTKFPNHAEVPVVLETRQYDYKKKMKGEESSNKNPLFGVLDEHERMELLLHATANENENTIHSPSKQRNGRNGHGNDSPKKKHGLTTRSGRSRSCSNADKYEYNDVYTSTLVLHVRNELEQLRNSRSLLGCSCHSSSKKKKKRHMTERKIKDELRKRGKLPSTQLTKQELMDLLQDIMAEEPCCWGEDCPCVKNGIDCHADVCLCWQHDKKKQPTDNPSEIQTICGNRNGINLVDTKGIKAVRERYCQPVQQENDEKKEQ